MVHGSTYLFGMPTRTRIIPFLQQGARNLLFFSWPPIPLINASQPHCIHLPDIRSMSSLLCVPRVVTVRSLVSAASSYQQSIGSIALALCLPEHIEISPHSQSLQAAMYMAPRGMWSIRITYQRTADPLSFHVGEVLNSQRMLEHSAIVLSASGMPSFGGSFVCSSSHLMLVEMRIWTLWEANTLDEQLGSVVFFLPSGIIRVGVPGRFLSKLHACST